MGHRIPKRQCIPEVFVYLIPFRNSVIVEIGGTQTINYLYFGIGALNVEKHDGREFTVSAKDRVNEHKQAGFDMLPTDRRPADRPIKGRGHLF
jgi:hypothetical protein